MRWKIWYAESHTEEGETAEQWDAAPNEGVVCVAVRHGLDESGLMIGDIYCGSDWYWMANGAIEQSNSSSKNKDEWVEHNAPSEALLKKGKWVSDEEMQQTQTETMTWVTSNGN